MKELFDKIMSIDHQANQRLKEAMAQKEEEVLSVDEQKVKLAQSMKEQARDYLSKMETAEQHTIQVHLSQIDERAKEEKIRLEKIYQTHKDEWVNLLVDSVISLSAK